MAQTVLEKGESETAAIIKPGNTEEQSPEDMLDSQIEIMRSQMESIKDIYKKSINPTLQGAELSLKEYLESVEAMDAAARKLTTAGNEARDFQLGAWNNLNQNIEVTIEQATSEFIECLSNCRQTATNSRKEKLQSAKIRIVGYAKKIMSKQVSFQHASSKLDIAVLNLDSKSKDISKKLTALRNNNNSDLSRALGNTAISRKAMEREHSELMQLLQTKASKSIKQNVGMYVNTVIEGRK